MSKPRLYSGMQPSADSLQIGNYIGALMQWRDLQEAYDAFFSVVDLHALTQPNDPAELRDKTRRTAAQYIAAGIEPSKSTLYVQSHVPAHPELTRDLAERFNARYGETFRVPMPVIQQDTARIYDLQNPTAKMSKSAESDAGVLWLLDDPALSAKKIMRAVTDSEGSVRFDREAKPGVSNLLVIYAALTGRQIPAIEDEYSGRGYGDFKKGLAEVIVHEFEPVLSRALE